MVSMGMDMLGMGEFVPRYSSHASTHKIHVVGGMNAQVRRVASSSSAFPA
jgi:hypothetical protein